jgi:hypothetical protein
MSLSSNASGSPVSVVQLTSFLNELDPFTAEAPDGLKLQAPSLSGKDPFRFYHHEMHSVTTASCTTDEHPHDDDDPHGDENDVDDESVFSDSSLSTKGLDEGHLHESRGYGCGTATTAAPKRVVILPAHSRESLYDRRSIFAHYWGTTGQEPAELLRQHSSIPRSKSNVHLDCEGVVDGGDDSAPAAGQSSSPSPLSNRRSIFGAVGRGDPAGNDPQDQFCRHPRSFSTSSLPSECPSSASSFPPRPAWVLRERRTQSTSSLHPTHRPVLSSCLRHKEVGARRLSATPHRAPREPSPSTSSSSSRSTAAAASVSFDERVRVYTFDVPQENWSDGSWTKIFGL